ncbi:MAG: hypothetical protein OXC62_15070 [Aestuariivita sp.]|nr:hypothetical protein [Aestuariivita sp.]
MVNVVHDQRRRSTIQARHAKKWTDWETKRTAKKETAETVNWLTEIMCGLPEELRNTLALILDDATHEEATQVLGKE